MGPAQLVQFSLNSAGQVGTTLAGTTVFFNGVAAPILYTSATQVSVVSPFGLSGSKADVVVTYQGQVSSALTVSIGPAPPEFSL